MALTKRVRAEIQKCLDKQNEVLALLTKPGVLGVAKAIDENRALGSSYDLRNPKCMESASGLSKHINVSSIHGSEVVFLWTVRDMLTRILESDKPKTEAA